MMFSTAIMISVKFIAFVGGLRVKVFVFRLVVVFMLWRMIVAILVNFGVFLGCFITFVSAGSSSLSSPGTALSSLQ